MKTTNTSDNENQAKNTETYKKVIKAIQDGGMIKNINPSLINFMKINGSDEYSISYDFMSCKGRIKASDIDSIEREQCKAAFGSWNIWSTWEANM